MRKFSLLPLSVRSFIWACHTSSFSLEARKISLYRNNLLVICLNEWVWLQEVSLRVCVDLSCEKIVCLASLAFIISRANHRGRKEGRKEIKREEKREIACQEREDVFGSILCYFFHHRRHFFVFLRQVHSTFGISELRVIQNSDSMWELGKGCPQGEKKSDKLLFVVVFLSSSSRSKRERKKENCIE